MRLTPSPGTPGEGGGEGLPIAASPDTSHGLKLRSTPASSNDFCPATDATKTNVPRRCETITGATACATFTIPMTLTCNTRGPSLGERFENGNPNLPEPIAAA